MFMENISVKTILKCSKCGHIQNVRKKTLKYICCVCQSTEMKHIGGIKNGKNRRHSKS